MGENISFKSEADLYSLDSTSRGPYLEISNVINLFYVLRLKVCRGVLRPSPCNLGPDRIYKGIAVLWTCLLIEK